MNFFSRVTYNDRMSPLDFDLFRKIQVLMGVTPDFFEVCLMVRLKSFEVSSESRRAFLGSKLTSTRFISLSFPRRSTPTRSSTESR